jgi:hypothetical protein
MGRIILSLRKPPHEVANKILDWHDQAKLAGRMSRADALLLLAWHAYEQLPESKREVDPGGRSRSRGQFSAPVS